MERRALNEVRHVCLQVPSPLTDDLERLVSLMLHDHRHPLQSTVSTIYPCPPHPEPTTTHAHHPAAKDRDRDQRVLQSARDRERKPKGWVLEANSPAQHPVQRPIAVLPRSGSPFPLTFCCLVARRRPGPHPLPKARAPQRQGFPTRTPWLHGRRARLSPSLAFLCKDNSAAPNHTACPQSWAVRVDQSWTRSSSPSRPYPLGFGRKIARGAQGPCFPWSITFAPPGRGRPALWPCAHPVRPLSS